MKRIFVLLALFALLGRAAPAIAAALPVVTNAVTANRPLLIDPSSMPVAAGKATLIIGPLHRTNGVYAGDYRVKVFPYFLKNEKGRLAIVVPDAALVAISQGKVAQITGTATTSGKNGRLRAIAATATPADLNHGQLKLWFTAGDRKMIFEPTYHFAGQALAGGTIPATNDLTNRL